MATERSVLTDDEVARLLVNFLRSHGPATEDECCEVIKWAGQARIDSVLLQRALTGEIALGLVDGEVTFKLADASDDPA